MADSLYVAMAGAKQAMTTQAVYANNLANVTTNGFRADLMNAESVVANGSGFATTVYASPLENVTDFSPGPIMTTSRDLDIAVNGEGWIAVLTKDGKEAYTRAGNLEIGANGQLQTSTGHAVLGNGGPISIPPAASINIASDGTISVRLSGQDAKSIVTVDRIKLVNPDKKSLQKKPDGLIYKKEGGDAPFDANVKITSGALEGSNVNPVDALINIVSAARNFEMQVKMMQQTDKTGQSLAQVLQIS